HATSLLAADFDGDGHVDLLVGESLDTGLGGGRVVVLRGDGDGGFSRAVVAPVRTAPTHLATADFDGDGHLDVAALLDAETHVVLVLRGGGACCAAALPFPGRPGVALCAADINGDGTPDLLAPSPGAPDHPDTVDGYLGVR